jgi:hypothetical protein
MIKFDFRCLAACALVLLSNCAKTATIGPTGFDQPNFQYRLNYQDAARGVFFGPDWQLDNYFLEGGRLKAKKGPEYVAMREIDEDGDGTVSQWEKKEEFIYDLRFVNVHDDGILWIKAHPLSQQSVQKDLDVLLNNYADGLSGTGLYAQSNLFSVERVKARQFTSFVVSKQPVTVGNNTGLVGVIELAETERLRLDPQYRSAKIKIAIARFAYYEPIGRYGSGPWPVVNYRGQNRVQRIGLFVVGYYNSAAKFEGQMQTFDQALAQLSFGPESAIGSPPAPANVASPAPSAAPPTPASSPPAAH